ncbi:MAG: VWA domain-containing protein [Candidatus Chloroheliales bacterium]|nr:MAG: VWA domain-containing protein [Chloroflexota bacterium]
MADPITLNVQMARPTLPALGTVQVAQAMVEVRPNAAAFADAPTSLNMCLVVDVSGSMEAQNKLNYAKEAVKLVLDRFGPQDAISVVAFNSRHQTIVPAQLADEANRPKIKRDIDALRASGGTRMAPAMREALRQLALGARLGGAGNSPLNRIVLLTDGRTEAEADCLNAATLAAQQHVGITALGLGTGWNERLLDEIAARTGGVADYVDQPSRIVDSFQEAVRSLQQVVIDNATLRFRLASGVSLRNVYKVVPQISQLASAPNIGADFGVVSEYYLGQIERGRGQALMIEMLLPPSEAGRFRVASAELTFDLPASRQRGLIVSSDIIATFEPPAQLPSIPPANQGVMSVVEKVTAYKLQERAMDDLSAGQTDAAIQKLQGAATRMLSQGEIEMAQRLTAEAQNLQANQPISDEARKALNYGLRKTVHLNLNDPNNPLF